MSTCSLARKVKLNDLANRYRFAFYLFGPPDTTYNKLRMASFVSIKKPKEYEIFVEDDQKLLVFWNPYDEAQVEQS